MFCSSLMVRNQLAHRLKMKAAQTAHAGTAHLAAAISVLAPTFLPGASSPVLLLPHPRDPALSSRGVQSGALAKAPYSLEELQQRTQKRVDSRAAFSKILDGAKADER
jgi:hypothetical protein